MARKTGQKTRSCTFRLPEDRYEVLAEVAKERGIDVSAVLNMIVSDAVPQLTEWLTARQRIMTPHHLNLWQDVVRLLANLQTTDAEVEKFLVAMLTVAHAPAEKVAEAIEAHKEPLMKILGDTNDFVERAKRFVEPFRARIRAKKENP